MLIKQNNKISITMQAKKALIRAYAFFRPLIIQKAKY